METYTPTHLRPWSHPAHYLGATWNGWYAFLGQTRDSDCLTRSNFRVAFKAVHNASVAFDSEAYDAGDELGGVVIVRENHYLCGWVEWIAIHESNHAALEKADDMVDKIENCHPVLCENDFSTLEDEEATEVWQSLPRRDRLYIIRGVRGISLFAARHAWYPNDDQGTVQSRLLGH